MARPFKLEAVLTHRQHQEESARRVFADAAREWNRARQALADMEKVRAQYRRALWRKQDSNGSARELFLYTPYLALLGRVIGAQAHTVQTLATDKEKKRKALMTALKDRKMIEKLKER